MKRYFYFFLLLVSHLISAEEPIGYIAYSTINIGDDIQAIAAKQFLPENALEIDREFISDFTHTEKLNVLMNGWYMHHKEGYWDLSMPAPQNSWPPSEFINPFFISIHLTGSFLPIVLSDENVEYLKKHSPIGARDFFTLEKLQSKGIPSYFSGCLTLTLQNPFHERNDIVYLVDLDEQTIQYIKACTHSPIVEITHGKPLLRSLSSEHRLKYAEYFLNLYRKAKCVVTTRLHAALPCLAFNTPILMISSQMPGGMDPRFQGLVEHTWHCSRQELLEGLFTFNFDDPPKNPNTHISIRNNLIETVQDWVNKQNR